MELIWRHLRHRSEFRVHYEVLVLQTVPSSEVTSPGPRFQLSHPHTLRHHALPSRLSSILLQLIHSSRRTSLSPGRAALTRSTLLCFEASGRPEGLFDCLSDTDNTHPDAVTMTEAFTFGDLFWKSRRKGKKASGREYIRTRRTNYSCASSWESY